MELNEVVERMPEIHKTARLYLVDYVGNMVFPATPRFEASRQRWTVTIMCATDRGTLPAGFLEFDARGNLVSAPTREQVEELASRMRQATPLLVRGEREEIEKAGFQVISD